MRIDGHITFSALCWTSTCTVTGSHVGLFPLVIALAGCTLPDIDHPGSWLGRRAPFLSYPISAIFGHRGITHSLLAVALCMFLSTNSGVASYFVAPLAVGYISHLVADTFTPSGVPWMWPDEKTYSLKLFKGDSALALFSTAMFAGIAGMLTLRQGFGLA